MIKISKEVFEQWSVLSWNLDGHLTLDLSQFGDVRAKFLVQVGHDQGVGQRVVLDHSHDIADTKTVLQEHRGA